MSTLWSAARQTGVRCRPNRFLRAADISGRVYTFHFGFVASPPDKKNKEEPIGSAAMMALERDKSVCFHSRQKSIASSSSSSSFRQEEEKEKENHRRRNTTSSDGIYAGEVHTLRYKCAGIIVSGLVGFLTFWSALVTFSADRE